MVFLTIFLPIVLFIGIMFSYFWALCIYECLFLRIKSIYKALIILFVLALLGGSCFYLFKGGAMFIFSFAFGLITLLIILLIFRKQKFENINLLYYIKSKAPEPSQRALEKYRLILFSIGLLGTLTSIWQLEVPQRIIVNLLPVKLEIVNDDFEYIENPKQNFSAFIDSNLDFEEEKIKRFLNFTYSKINIYACDDFDCKGDKKYVGFYWEPWSYASTLGCISLGGGCNRYIKRNKRGRDYLMSFIENKKQKK